MLSNKKAISFILLIVISSVVGLQCKKDVAINISNTADCRGPWPCDGQGFMFFLGPVQNSAPFFNPVNPNQFLYIEKDKPGNTSIVTYDMVTKQKQYVITKFDAFLDAKWSLTGWIVTQDASDQNFYRIKPDGTGLTKIRNCENLGDFFLPPVSVADIVASGVGYSISFKFDGTTVDSFPNKEFQFGDVCNTEDPSGKWYLACHSTSAPYPSTITVKSIDDLIATDVYIPYSQLYRNWDYTALSWHPNGEDIYYASYLDIQKVNIKTYTHSIVKLGCSIEPYSKIRVSPDGKKILAEKAYFYFDDKCKIYYNTDLVIMNIDGSDERKVFN